MTNKDGPTTSPNTEKGREALRHHRRHALWVFWWVGPGRDYPCSISSYTRAECIKEATEFIGITWKQLYRQGGRVIRCDIVPQTKESP